MHLEEVFYSNLSLLSPDPRSTASLPSHVFPPLPAASQAWPFLIMPPFLLSKCKHPRLGNCNLEQGERADLARVLADCNDSGHNCAHLDRVVVPVPHLLGLQVTQRRAGPPCCTSGASTQSLSGPSSLAPGKRSFQLLCYIQAVVFQVPYYGLPGGRGRLEHVLRRRRFLGPLPRGCHPVPAPACTVHPPGRPSLLWLLCRRAQCPEHCLRQVGRCLGRSRDTTGS